MKTPSPWNLVLSRFTQFGALLCGLAALTSGCSNARLAVPSAQILSVQSKGQFCLKPPVASQGSTKFMFIIDKSGSNAISPGTDPKNKYRADSIQAFFNGVGPDGAPRSQNSNIKWGYLAFNGDNATPFITDGGNNPIFVGVNDSPNDVTAMNNALSMQRNIPDNDATPYHSALQMAQKAIKNDLSAHPDDHSQYILFFMSDGKPTDYNAFGNEQPAGAAAFKDVDDLMNASPGNVIFSTAYYGPNDASAAAGLSTMAQHGKGKFVNLNSTTDFKIDDLLTGSQSAEPYNMKNFLVFNVNSAIGIFNGGEFCADSDGDGLCDEDEIKLTQMGYGNFDPQNRYSYNDGYGDYFHYLEAIKLAKLTPCLDRSDDDHDLLTACEEKFMAVDTLPGGTVPLHKNADSKNPDTDGDGFIDGIEWLMLHNKSSPLDPGNMWTHPTGVSDSLNTLIMHHINPANFNANANPLSTYDTNVQFDHVNNSGQKCYSFSQNTLQTFHTLPVSAAQTISPDYAHAEWDNMILIYYIQTLEKDPGSPGIYNYSVQPVSGNPVQGTTHLNLRVDDTSFKAYIVPTN